jgi:uncharacterized protein YqhQ
LGVPQGAEHEIFTTTYALQMTLGNLNNLIALHSKCGWDVVAGV